MYLWLVDLGPAYWDKLKSCIVAAHSQEEAWKLVQKHKKLSQNLYSVDFNSDKINIIRVGNTWLDANIVHENVI